MIRQVLTRKETRTAETSLVMQLKRVKQDHQVRNRGIHSRFWIQFSCILTSSLLVLSLKTTLMSLLRCWVYSTPCLESINAFECQTRISSITSLEDSSNRHSFVQWSQENLSFRCFCFKMRSILLWSFTSHYTHFVWRDMREYSLKVDKNRRYRTGVKTRVGVILTNKLFLFSYK